jgi:hypothetical protein
MAFNLPNFVGQNYTPDYSGIGDVVQNYYQGKVAPSQALVEQVKAMFAQPNAEADLQKTQLENIGQEIKNRFAPATSEADIALKNQMAKVYGMGGGGRGNMTTQLMFQLKNQLKTDNPSLTDDQLNDAVNNTLGGNFSLSDGTPFNGGNAAKIYASKLVTSSQPNAITTSNVRANQAEAEMPIVDKYIQEGRTPYGDTVFGHSPQQFADTLNTKSDAAQERLGKYGASQLLSLEKAGLGLKMAGIESGQNIMNEAMQKAGQTIKTFDFLKTDKARQTTLDTYRQALEEMLAARKSVGVLGSGSVSNSNAGQSQPQSGVVNYSIINGKLVRG